VGIAELFDKTWFVALLMAVKYDKNLVFWSCFSALGVHTLIAVVIGATINKLLPISVLHFGATLLYTFFAFLYLKDWYYADPDSDIIEAGKAEAGEDLGEPEEQDGKVQHVELGEVVGASENIESSVEELDGLTKAVDDVAESPKSATGTLGTTNGVAVAANGKKNVAERRRKNWQAVACQCFMAMFIAEWGDRTQIAMIGQHASQPLIPVCVGSLLAFFLLTVSAVMVGMCLDGMRLSEKKVHLVSSLSFFVFAGMAVMDGIASLGEKTPGT
jgi:putative Ca2+/H+ antiporter (TMEM165/GDT1 family)